MRAGHGAGRPGRRGDRRVAGIGRAIAQTLAAMQTHVIVNYVAHQDAAEETRHSIEAIGGEATICCLMWPMRWGRLGPLMQSSTTAAASIF